MKNKFDPRKLKERNEKNKQGLNFLNFFLISDRNERQQFSRYKIDWHKNLNEKLTIESREGHSKVNPESMKDKKILTRMRSWIRFEIPRLAITKSLVTGPGTASVVPSLRPGVGAPAATSPCWELPLPATSCKIFEVTKLSSSGGWDVVEFYTVKKKLISMSY